MPALDTGVLHEHDEGGGLPRVTVVMPGDVPALMTAMAAGDRRAARLLPPVLLIRPE
jgi:hypothetical protein